VRYPVLDDAEEAKPPPARYLLILKEKLMRILKLSVALAMVASSFGLASAASAQHHDDHRPRIVGVGRYADVRHGDARRGHDARRDDRRYHRPPRRVVHRARHCRMEWRHHRRVRVCR
jgi:hypothetical protein